MHDIQTCDDCGHLYDTTDTRADVKLKICPACNIVGHSMKAWAVWNSCQGVFPCGVRDRKFMAQALIDKGNYTPEETVVPVRIVLESGMDKWHRDLAERHGSTSPL